MYTNQVFLCSKSIQLSADILEIAYDLELAGPLKEGNPCFGL